MIHLRNLNKIYKTTEVETTALNSIDLDIEAGEFISIMGTSGCGKSTLLNILGLLDRPNSGEYLLNGRNVIQLSEKERSVIRKQQMGFIFQNFNLIDELTVFENIELPLFYLGLNKSDRRIRVEDTLNKMGILHRMKHYPKQLSGGQQQRVAVCRAIIGKPKLILADEPTGNLDSHYGREVLDSLCALNEMGTTIVMVTHSRDDASYSQRVIQLFDGKLLGERSLQPNTL
jgi:putative ABC transport system ATP-binding protein